MDNKLVKFLKHLYKLSSPISCKELAQQFDVSTRTIQNYVKNINYLSAKKIIISGKNGYLLDKVKANILFQTIDTTVPQDNASRCSYILKKILTHTNESINVFDISDELFISYSTFRSVLVYTNNYLKKYNLKVISKNNILYIQGDEKDLRKIMSIIIYDEATVNRFSIENLYEYFNSTLVKKIVAFLDSFSKKNGLVINDFTKTNLILHFCILIKRIQEGKVDTANSTEKISPEFDYELINELHQKLFDEFNIDMNNSDLREAYLLIQINSNLNSASIDDIFEKEIIELTKNIIEQIKNNYLVDLNTNEFFIPFALHLKRLIIRIQNGKSGRNPLLNHVKKTIPMIYDISTYVSLYINNLFKNEVIAEDEIAFIALHIGTEIHRQKSDYERISTLLVLPKYLNLGNYIKNEIFKNFQDDLNIMNVVESVESFDNSSSNAELIITTFPLSYFKTDYMPDIISISPFLTSEDQLIIYEGIESIRKKRLNSILINQFNYFFDEELFHLDNGLYHNEYDVIDFLGKDLIKKAYAPEEFLLHVINREKLSSTAFKNVAVPHQFFVETMQTGINILISKEGLIWGNSIVNIVLMVCINNEDKKIFTYLYEALLNLFTQDNIVQTVKDSNCFEDFKSKVLLFIEK